MSRTHGDPANEGARGHPRPTDTSGWWCTAAGWGLMRLPGELGERAGSGTGRKSAVRV